MTTLALSSPAKLNLFLHINGKRDDGYHELQTYFLLIGGAGVCDELTFSARTDGQIDFVYHSPSAQEPTINQSAINQPHKSGCNNELNDRFDAGFMHNNLVVRAAKLLQTHTNCTLGTSITLKKRLPLGGGLGGGSSNAAAALVALSKLWQLGLSTDQLAVLGKRLGADVPVFIHGQSAWADGIGDRLIPFVPCELEPLCNRQSKTVLVLTPNVHVSTAELFAHPKLPRSTPKFAMSDYQLSDERFVNDFEALVLAQYPLIRAALSHLQNFAGQLMMPARLTGTGASVFAIFKTEAEAQMALERAPCSGFLAVPMVGHAHTNTPT